MKQFIINVIKRTPLWNPLWKLRQDIRMRRMTEGSTKLNVLKTFPFFEASSSGLYAIRAKLAIQSINQVIPALASLASFSDLNKKNQAFKEGLDQFFINTTPEQDVLGRLFTQYGSDKAGKHNYFLLYASILNSMESVAKVFEIGLGTNNPDVVSTMGKWGRPGASLRAFRDYLSDADVFGADFDRRVLFEEERIKTYFVDQTDPDTFEELGNKIGGNFDLMIDDGLHSPNANLHSLNFFLPRLKVGGYAVIEDIPPLNVDLWKIVSLLLGENYLSAFISTKLSCVFVVKRVA